MVKENKKLINLKHVSNQITANVNSRIFVVLIILTMIVLSVSFVIAQEDEEKKFEYYNDNIENFVNWGEGGRSQTEFMRSLPKSQRKIINDKVRDHFGLSIDLGDGLTDENLDWEGSTVFYKEGDKKVAVSFENFPESLFTKVDFDPDTLEFVFTTATGGEVRIDQGTIEPDGRHNLLDDEERIPGFPEAYFTNVEDGGITYREGEYSIKGKASLNVVQKIGEAGEFGSKERLYSKFKEGETKVSIDGRKVVSINSKIEVNNVDTEGVREKVAVVSGSTKHKIAGFIDGEDHSQEDVAYWQIDGSRLIMRGNDKADFSGLKKDGEGDHYLNVRVFQDFDEVLGQGDNTVLANGKSWVIFSKDGVHKNRGNFPIANEIFKISNIEDDKGRVFGWQKLLGNEDSSVLYDTAGRYNSIIGETAVSVTAGGRFIRRTQTETTSQVILENIPAELLKAVYRPPGASLSDLEGLSPAARQETLKGWEEQRLDAIALHQGTSIAVKFPKQASGLMVAGELKKIVEARFASVKTELGPIGNVHKEVGVEALTWPPIPDVGYDITNREAAGIMVYDSYFTGEFKDFIDQVRSFSRISEMKYGTNEVTITGRFPGGEIRTIRTILSPETALALKYGSLNNPPNNIIKRSVSLRTGLSLRGADPEVARRILGIGINYNDAFFNNYATEKYE